MIGNLDCLLICVLLLLFLVSLLEEQEPLAVASGFEVVSENSSKHLQQIQ
jgi:hypothetical protein